MKANQYIGAKQYDKAIPLYTQILVDTHDPLIYLNRALGHLNLKQYEKCISDCSTALSSELQEKHICKAKWRRGIAFESTRRFNDAILDFKDVIMSEFYDGNKAELYQHINKLDFECFRDQVKAFGENATRDPFSVGSADKVSRLYIASRMELVNAKVKGVDASFLLPLFEECAVEPYFVDQLMNLDELYLNHRLATLILKEKYTRTSYATVMVEKWGFDLSLLLDTPEMLVDILATEPKLGSRQLLQKVIQFITQRNPTDIYFIILQILIDDSVKVSLEFIDMLWKREVFGVLDAMSKFDPRILDRNIDCDELLSAAIKKGNTKYAVNLVFKIILNGGTISRLQTLKSILETSKDETVIANSLLCISETVKKSSQDFQTLKSLTLTLLSLTKTVRNETCRKNLGICLSSIIIMDERLRVFIREGNGLEFLHSVARR